jgi:hypothetical protein
MKRGGVYTFSGGKGLRSGSGLSWRGSSSGYGYEGERVTVVLDDFVKLLGQSGGLFV